MRQPHRRTFFILQPLTPRIASHPSSPSPLDPAYNHANVCEPPPVVHTGRRRGVYGARRRRLRAPGRRRRAPLPRVRPPRRHPGGEPRALLLPQEPRRRGSGRRRGGGLRHAVRAEERRQGRAAGAPGARRQEESGAGQGAVQVAQPQVVGLRVQVVRRVAGQPRRRPAARRRQGAQRLISSIACGFCNNS
jgi:hypothetical protein